jgi:hypothetical protein
MLGDIFGEWFKVVQARGTQNLTITSDPWGMWFVITDSSLPLDPPPCAQSEAQIPFPVDMTVTTPLGLAPSDRVLVPPPPP